MEERTIYLEVTKKMGKKRTRMRTASGVMYVNATLREIENTREATRRTLGTDSNDPCEILITTVQLRRSSSFARRRFELQATADVFRKEEEKKPLPLPPHLSPSSRQPAAPLLPPGPPRTACSAPR